MKKRSVSFRLPEGGDIKCFAPKCQQVGITDQLPGHLALAGLEGDDLFDDVPQSQVVQTDVAPMWACKVDVVRHLSSFEVHECMMGLGHLRNMCELSPEDRKCIFLSQTWFSIDHPDPEGVKFRLLQTLLVEMESCSVEFPMHWHEQLFSEYSCLTKEQARDHVKNGHVWMDYWSVPRKEFNKQQAHIDSISTYVQMSSLFIALVPPSQHRDTGDMVDITSWEERGWCRLEAISNVLSARPAPLLVVESLGNRWLGTNHWMIKPVGQGKFTCCQLDHVLPNGQEIRCDKTRIARTLEKLFDFKIEGADDADDMFTLRLMQCLREHLLGGLSVQKARERTLVEWMERFRFFTPFACQGSGWTPLRYAVYEGRLDIAEELISMKADLESSLTSDFCKQVFFHHKDMTILHGAAMVQSSPEVVRFLIDKRADVNRTFGSGFTTALAAAIGSAAHNFEALVDAGCTMTGTDLRTAVEIDPTMLRVCAQKCPELLGELEPADLLMCSSDSDRSQAAAMWALPNSSVQQLSRFEPHEELVDGRLENLVVSGKESHRCMFVSQTWLSFDHPDPDGVKFRLLLGFLEGVHAGRVSFPLYWQEQPFSCSGSISKEEVKEAAKNSHVWVDYWSVPQRDLESQRQYIHCLGLFVQTSSLFVALAPPCQHRNTKEMIDIKTWEGRGWCRLESAAHALSDSAAPFLIVESLGSCWLGCSATQLIRPPGLGRFTCCQRNHLLKNGRSIMCDKERVAGLMENLLERRLETARYTGDVFTYRLTESLRRPLLTGLPILASAREADLREWLFRFAFSSPIGGDDGWTPLRYAVYEGRLDVAEKLLQAGVDIEAPLKGDFQEHVYFHREGLTILQGACLLKNAPELVTFLIGHSADVHRTFGDGKFNALFASALVSATGNFEALLDSGCDACGATEDVVMTAIQNNPEILSIYCRKCLAHP